MLIVNSPFYTLDTALAFALLAVGTVSSPTSLLCISHPTSLDSQAAQPSKRLGSDSLILSLRTSGSFGSCSIGNY